jgi:hypothetical protein
VARTSSPSLGDQIEDKLVTFGGTFLFFRPVVSLSFISES